MWEIPEDLSMLYKYDEAIIDDLKRTIDPEGGANPNVIAYNVEAYQSVLAQMQEDKITYPLILVYRHDDTPIKTELLNFTRYMKGVPAVIDPKTNNIYYEKAVPVDVRYTLYVITTNVADRDEICRELYFKYQSMYYLHIVTPYEATRRLRFGIQLDKSSGIQNESGAVQYTQSGAIYQSKLELITDGCVLLDYTPKHLSINVVEGIRIENPTGDAL